ncbi:MAG: hypothetical protein M3116_02700 [Actinomycetota bacterium]|nr:hypothetical protein [Actinomycetota bacterium]
MIRSPGRGDPELTGERYLGGDRTPDVEDAAVGLVHAGDVVVDAPLREPLPHIGIAEQLVRSMSPHEAYACGVSAVYAALW